jgi:hypothetical protein
VGWDCEFYVDLSFIAGWVRGLLIWSCVADRRLV